MRPWQAPRLSWGEGAPGGASSITRRRGACFYASLTLELAILELLAQQGPLAVDRIADTLNESQQEVGGAMWLLAH